MTEPSDFMSVREVALHIGVSPMTVYRLIESGRLAAVNVAVSSEKLRFRIARASVAAFLDGAVVVKESA